MEKNSLASKVINIDGLPRRGVLRKTTAEGTQGMTIETNSKTDQIGRINAAVSIQKENNVADLSKGKDNNMAASADIDVTGRKSYADQLLANGNISTNAEVNFRYLQHPEVRPIWRPKEKVVTNIVGESSISMHNQFEVLNASGKGCTEPRSRDANESDEDDVETVFDETVGLVDEEAKCVLQFNQASLDKERFLKQKSKLHWLAVGDANNAFFHKSLKCKNHGNRIEMVKDSNGLLHEGEDVHLAFVSHFEKFLGSEEGVSMPISPDLFTCRLDDSAAVYMIRPILEEDIRKAMFSIGDNKSPGYS
ncbi:hypothetical protein QVD17_19959 [Tagetes erecta]|uniref:Uncharacterized protein n=1 Tax=Tagetes erecta TaxID=13708 RepID=A0AAD8KNP7_TARER|nr:hypothetical protein QVD17_19959 [Tagetes erecta]